MPLSSLPLAPPPAAETRLVARLCARDESAMTAFYERYGSTLYRRILRLVRCPATAEDLLQEGLVKIWHAMPDYDAARGRLFSWSLTICQRRAIDHLRSAPHRLTCRTVWDEEHAALHQLPSTGSAEYLGVRELLHALPPAYRRVLELRFFEGYTQQEVADYLALPLGTVKTRNRTALQQLAGLFRIPLPA
ncbi:RNA polymerase sigma factor [Hymenobacter sp. GOD-10R]|uniref:RNA polymerase sigma factor n=1 Tax=Hymenobacter sp. GOD-10R TaxID=3093922 RepID=UPI002D77B23C|nr:sigma-70 family RNA polymerase sigma factor [Hymenobacter sp. GOD-10R]WRQ31973.1 sigma-70 family RNA polymerase sigma factor [Hymenobacter sp. GOD-10R]